MCKTGLAILGWTGAGAILGAGGGLVFGVLFALLDGLIRCDPRRMVLDGAFAALCGAVAGAILGVFGRVTDREGVACLMTGWTNDLAQEYRFLILPEPAGPARSIAGDRSQNGRGLASPRRNAAGRL
jgi:hypothetical protein